MYLPQTLFVGVALIAGCMTLALAQQPTQSPKAAPPATTSPAPPGRTLDDATLGKMFDAFATIAGGWYLEQRCDTLAKNLKDELDWYAAQTNIALTRQAGPTFIRRLQQAAQEVAGKTTCDDKARQAILAAMIVGKDATKLLTGQIYNPATASELNAKYTVMLIVGQSVDDKCKTMPADIRREYEGRTLSTLNSLLQSAGTAATDRVKTAANEILQKSPIACEKAEDFLKGMLAQARRMTPQWKAN